MLIRVSRGVRGFIDYLESGLRSDWNKTRQEKDNVRVIYGNREIFRKTEEYLYNEKNWKDNYLHITLSLSEEDEIKLSNMNNDEANDMLRDMVVAVIKHHTSGYDIDNEVIAYAERHIPKIKKNEKGVDRRDHIHIGIALYNPLSDTKLRTTFAKNEYIDTVLQTYLNKKFGLTIPRGKKREGRKPSKKGELRKYYIEELKDIKSKDELLEYFKANNIEYKEVKTKKNHYYKIIDDSGNNINLRGKGFEHIQEITDKNTVFPESQQIKELEAILEEYYHKRIETITKRESRKTREKKEEIYKDVGNENEDSLSMSYQQKIFYKHYGVKLGDKLKGYYVDTKNDKEVKFINKKKNIRVIDKGDRVVGNEGGDLKEKVRLMIDIAEAKGWNLATVRIHGSQEFIREAKRQIAQRLRADQERHKNLTSTLAVAKRKAEEKPRCEAEQIHKDDVEEKDREEAEKKSDIQLLKKTLRAEYVLAYAVEKFGIEARDYEITEDNKINNKKNKQKPKNVIDFLQKEIGMTTKEAIAQAQALFDKQPLRVDAEQLPAPEKALKPVAIKPMKKGMNDEQRILYQSLDRADHRRSDKAENGMRPLSHIDLLHHKHKRDRVLLSGDERHHLQSKSVAAGRVQSTRDRSAKAPGENGKREERRELNMPLSISICKDQSPAAVSGWQVAQVSSYGELATLMKQYPYSAAVFKNGYRKGENVEAFSNILILDIDNDKYAKQLSIDDAKNLLNKHGISAMIMPSRSHLKPKKVASDHQKRHGKPVVEEYHAAERFRIVIPTNRAFSSLDLAHYREFMQTAARALSLEEYTDPKALRDRARFYYKSPIEAAPHIIKANRVMKIDEIERVAIERVERRRAQKEAERRKIEEIRANVAKYRAVSEQRSDTLSYANVEAIINTPIVPIINHYERSEKYKEGSYTMIRTDRAKYSVIEENVAHDFKSDKTYNTLTYMQERLGTINLNRIARELEKITDGEYMQVNYDAIERAVRQAMKSATGDKIFQEEIKEFFGVKYCKLGKDTLTIADKTIKLSEIGIEKSELIEAFRRNRGEDDGERKPDAKEHIAEMLAKRAAEEKKMKPKPEGKEKEEKEPEHDEKEEGEEKVRPERKEEKPKPTKVKPGGGRGMGM